MVVILGDLGEVWMGGEECACYYHGDSGVRGAKVIREGVSTAVTISFLWMNHEVLPQADLGLLDSHYLREEITGFTPLSR